MFVNILIKKGHEKKRLDIASLSLFTPNNICRFVTMNSGLATQVNAFIKKAEDMHKRIEAFNSDLDKLCETILTLLCMIGSAADGGMKAEEVRKISIPRDADGAISARVDYLKRGLLVITSAISDYSSVSSAITDVKTGRLMESRSVRFEEMKTVGNTVPLREKSDDDDGRINYAHFRSGHMPGAFAEAEAPRRRHTDSSSRLSVNTSGRHRKAPSQVQKTLWNLFNS